MLAAKLGGNVGHWITRPLTWDADEYDPLVAPKFETEDTILHLLWQDLDTKLAQKIEAVGRKVALATRGAVLCFFGRAQLTIIVEYTRSGGGAVNLRPVAAVQDPAGLFELDELFDRQPPQIRNLLKKSALVTPTEKIMLSLTTFADELERDKARQRVHDAMSRKARNGHVTGGKTFGYDNITITTPDGKRSHVARCINEREAAIVRRIFEMSAAGTGYSRIAKLPEMKTIEPYSPTARASASAKPVSAGGITAGRTTRTKV